MVVIPLKVEHVPIQLVLCLSSLVFLFNNFSISLFLQLVVFVASIVSSCFLAMIRPFPWAEPTKLVRAHLASHVVAALVLFNRFPAFGTLLCVCHDPGDILTLCWVLATPGFSHLAIARTMRFMPTSEAKWISTFAIDVWFSRVSVLDAVVAPLVWAPTNILVVICVSFTVPLHVCLQIFSCEVFQELRVRYNNIAHVLRALGKDTLESILHLLLQVVGPILFAELMATQQWISPWHVTCGVELHVANLAVPLVCFGERLTHEGILFGQFLVELNAYLLPQHLLVAEPFVVELVLVPLEVAHYWQSLVVIAVKQVLH